MDFEMALHARLIAAAPVAAQVADRVFWIDRPQGSELSAITLQIVIEDREQHMQGFQGRQFVTVQVDGWAETYAKAKALKEAIIAALIPPAEVDGVRFGRASVVARDLSERTETRLLFRPSMDFTFNYSAQ